MAQRQRRTPDEMIAYAGERATALHEYIFALPAEQVRGNPWAIVDAIDEFANEKGLPLIFRQNKLELSRGVLGAMNPKPKVVVEFGTFVGNSALAWGASLRDFYGQGTDGLHVFAFELQPKFAQIARDFVKLASLDDIITVLEGTGAESLKKLHEEGKVVPGGVDVIFLDHWKDVYLPDLKLVEQLKLFHTGSVIIADNTDFPGAPDYVEYVKKGGSGESGAFRYETESLEAAGQERGPKIVMVSKVVD